MSSSSSSSLDAVSLILLIMGHATLLMIGNLLMARTTWNVVRMIWQMDSDFERYTMTIYRDWNILFYVILWTKVAYVFYEQYMILINSSGLSSGENPYLGKSFSVQVMVLFSVFTSSIPSYFLVWLHRMIGEIIRFKENTSSQTSEVLSNISPVKKTMRWMGYEKNEKNEMNVRGQESASTPTRVHRVSSPCSSMVFTPTKPPGVKLVRQCSTRSPRKNGVVLSRFRNTKPSSISGRIVSRPLTVTPTKSDGTKNGLRSDWIATTINPNGQK